MNVRCQARRAVRKSFEDALQMFGNEIVASIPTKGYTKKYTGPQLLVSLDSRELSYRDLKVEYFTGVSLKPFNYYANTQVAYEFTLDLKENNAQGFNIDLIRQFLRRADKIGISITSDRTRQLTRTFTVQDSFFNLATKIDDSQCSSEFSQNIAFPLTGYMPVQDLVATYISINEFNILTKLKPNLEDYKAFQGTEDGPATPQMADTIIFTTKLIGKNEPTIEYKPVGPGFDVAGLGFTNNNSREDMHKVIVTVTTSPVTKIKPGTKGERVINPTPQERREDALNAIWAQRERNFQDAVIGIGNNLQRLNGL